jgi:alpha-ketoglutarate-dependent taurine dioxygenase
VALAASSSWSVTPLVRHEEGLEFGARITGIDLAAPLDAAQWAAIDDAWSRFALLVFPGQALRPADEAAFYRRFRYHDDSAPPSVRRAPIAEAPDVGLIGSAALRDHHGVTGTLRPGGAGVQWHIDGYYDGDLPPAATQLYCVESPAPGTGGVLRLAGAGGGEAAVPYEGGATIFADTRLAYLRLGAKLRSFADSHEVQYWPGGLHGAWHAGTDNPPMDEFGLVPTQPPELFDYLDGDPTAAAAAVAAAGHASSSSSSSSSSSAAAESEPRDGEEGAPDLGAGAFHDVEQADLSELRAARHPLVWCHPHTGIPALQVHTLSMDHLVPIQEAAASTTPAAAVAEGEEPLDWGASQAIVKVGSANT